MDYLGILFLIISLIIHIFATDFTLNKGKGIVKIEESNYYDIVHHSFKDLSEYHYIKNFLTLGIIIPILFYPRKEVFFDLFKIIPIIIIIRSVLTSVTIFPSVRNGGDIQRTDTFLDYFIGDNHDRMFSGHVSFTTLISYLLIKWNYVNIPSLSLVFLFLYNIIHAFIIIVTRSHYTIDVLNSMIITFLLSIKI